MNLKLTLDKAQEAYKKANSDQKALLIDLYGYEHFLTSVKDRLKGYESACIILGKIPLTIESFNFLGSVQAKKQYARHKIVTGFEAINEGWVPDYDNTNQAKYEIWVEGKKYGFSSSVNYYCFFTSVGSDMIAETRENAELIEKLFKQDLIDYLF